DQPNRPVPDDQIWPVPKGSDQAAVPCSPGAPPAGSDLPAQRNDRNGPPALFPVNLATVEPASFQCLPEAAHSLRPQQPDLAVQVMHVCPPYHSVSAAGARARCKPRA